MPHRVFIHLALVFCIYLLVVTAWNLPTAKLAAAAAGASNSLRRRQLPLSPNCGFPGNSDAYGLGIRLGIYLQWTSALISKHYLVASNAQILRELLDVNTIFCLAIFIATALLSTQSDSHGARGAEILIMLHIYFGNTYIISYEQLLRGTYSRGLTFLGVTSTVFITAGMSCYAVYYWFHALDILPVTSCGAFGFLFTKVALDGPARTFFKIVAVINMIVWGAGFLLLAGYAIPLLLLVLVQMLYHSTKHGILVLLKTVLRSDVEVSAPWRNTNKGHTRYYIGMYMGIFAAPKREMKLQRAWPKNDRIGGWKKVFMLNESQENPIVRSWKYINLCVMTFSILAIELIIRWNSISGVYTIGSTGQVIPFTIGIGGLIKVLSTVPAQAFDNDSLWSAKIEAFRMHNGKWAKFPVKAPARRRSWAGERIERVDNQETA